MDDLSGFDTSVIKKYEKMRNKNEFLLQHFPEFPISETVIQNYRCSYKHGEKTIGGKLWLTQNYILFTGNGAQFCKQISYMEIDNTTIDPGFVGYTSHFILDLNNGLTITLLHFYHFNEACILIKYLIEHSPCYYHIPRKSQTLKNDENNQNIQQNHNDNKETHKNELSGRWSQLDLDVNVNKQQHSIEKYEKPDVKLAQECLQVANEIYEIGLDSRNTLEDQARSLDRIERDLTETRVNVKKGQREIESINSIGGGIKKTFMSNLVDKKLGVYEAPDRSAGTQEAEQFYDVPILIKHPNCDLESGILRFGNKIFFCATYPTELKQSDQIRDYKYNYQDVSSTIVRVRPLHLDIRFWNGKVNGRLRCISSHIQMIANELVLRTNGRCTVVFEPGPRKFDYGDEWLRRHPLSSGRNNDLDNSGLFERQSMRVSEIVNNAPKPIINALEEQENIIQTLQETVGNIKVNNDDIKEETIRQTEQINNVHTSLDKAMINMHKQEHQVRKLI